MSDTAVSASATEITFRHSNDQRLDDLLTRAFLLPYASTPSTPADGSFDFHPSATAPCLRDPTRGFHPFPPYPSAVPSLFLSRHLFRPLERAEITLRCFSLSRSHASGTLSPSSLLFVFYFSRSLDRSPRISRITRETISRRMANSPMTGSLRTGIERDKARRWYERSESLWMFMNFKGRASNGYNFSI